MKNIYMDNGATTRVTEPVFEAMRPYFCEVFGNPSSAHAFGYEAKHAVDKARAQVALALGADAGEIYFTGCGTEADNWALRGAAYAPGNARKTVVTTVIEHPAVLNAARQLEREGFRAVYVPVNSEGFVDMDAMRRAITQDTFLVSVMTANNEIGTVQPVSQIASLAHAAGALMHTDAVQAAGSIPVDVNELGVDLLSLSGHKFHGPKGVGALYIKSGVRIGRFLLGGEQERAQRAGTENLASIVGLGRAAELAADALCEKSRAVGALRDALIERVLSRVPLSRVNGSRVARLPGNANFSFEGVEGESLLLNLDLRGIAASSGSACSSGSLDPSHVLTAIGLTADEAKGSLRLSLNEENTMDEVEAVVSALAEIVSRLREMTGFSARGDRE